MNQSIPAAIVYGAIAGVAASVPQAVVGKVEEILLLPPGEDSNIAPRLVDRMARRLGQNPSREEEWLMGTIFHLAYGAGWGAMYGLSARKLSPGPLLGGTTLGSVIYGLTFPRWGGAVLTDVERPPKQRTPQMTFVAWSVALTFGIATGLMYDRLSRRSGSESAAEARMGPR